MKTIYIDAEHKCHTEAADGLTAVETDFFDGKCAAFVEGYRYIPESETTGGKAAPWKDYHILAAAQAQYEADQADLAAAYREGVNSV